jgi:hypothetical protein
MSLKFNPFSGNFDFTGAGGGGGGGGGGASYIDGEVATYADLPLDVSAALNSAWLVREASGVWPVSRKQAGIYIRTATGGSSRDADYTYAGTMPDVFSDAQFTLYGDVDSTKNVKFDVDAQVGANQTRVITVPNKNITLDDAGDSRTPSSHAHGNLTNAGAVGTVANLPLRTGASGVVQVGAFGTSTQALGVSSAGSSNDFSRADHVHAMPSAADIGAAASSHSHSNATQSVAGFLSTTDKTKLDGIASGATANSADATLLARANHTGTQAATTITGLATVATTGAYNDLSGRPTLGTAAAAATTDFAAASHTHAASAITSGTLDVARLPVGTGSTHVAAGNHTHVVADVTGAAASGSITTSGLTQATARILGRTTASTGAIEEIQIGSGLSLSAGELSATGGGGITAVGTTLADILSVSGSDLVADDLAADKLYGWDDSESKAIGFIIGSGLSVSGDTLSATASGGSKTYAVFTAEHNQPPATAFATLDTRNSAACLDFDDATDESAVFVSIIPEGASLGSGLKIRLHWMATTATSGNVVWDVSLERMTTDLDSDSFDTIASGTAAANGTSGILTVTEITLTTIDSVTAGDGFRLKVTRDANNASDTMTGDAELVVCEVRSAA